MRNFIAAVAVSALAIGLAAGCSKQSQVEFEAERNKINEDAVASVPGLEGCKLYRVKQKGEYDLKVVHCPMAITSTTVRESKTSKTIITVNGVGLEIEQGK